MNHRILALAAFLSCNLGATGISVTETEDGKKQYLITEGVFERPSGISVGAETKIGSVDTDIQLKYTTLIVTFDEHTITLSFQGSVSPLVHMFEKLLPGASELSADALSTEKPLTEKELAKLSHFFEEGEQLTDIAKAKLHKQKQFLKLMSFIKRKFPELKCKYTVSWFARMLNLFQ